MTRSAQLGRAVLSCFLLVLNAPALERAPSEPVVSPPTAGHSFVIRAKAVYPVTAEQPGPIERGMIVVRNGRIEAVGRDLDVPPDLPLIDLKDEVICPGFVSAGSSLAGRHAGAESVSGLYRALDAFDTYGEYTLTLSRGTTTVHLDPGGHRLVSGVGAVAKLAGPAEQRVLVPAADLNINMGVFDPPPVFKPPFYASSDVPIEPARWQRPHSRLGQYLELEERMAAAQSPASDGRVSGSDEGTKGRFDAHARLFAEVLASKLPLRIQVREAADIEGALAFIKQHAGMVGGAARPAYLVGLTEGGRVAASLAGSDLPVVLRIEQDYRHPGPNVGADPDAIEPRLSSAGEIANKRIALAGIEGDLTEDLRMAAVLAVRGGMPSEQALAAITRVPAEILGIGDRVGSLAPGKDADLLVLTADPLDINSCVRRAYVGGEAVFDSPLSRPITTQSSAATGALVIRAGTAWVGDGTTLQGVGRGDGGGRVEVLIEDGKIQAVGPRVPHPPFARIIDAGADSFLTPGFIDAHGHLGLAGDQTVATPDVSPHLTVGVTGREFQRVARAGVTTVMLAPYRGAPNGARLAAIKTYGEGRNELVARELSGLKFSLRGGQDPLVGVQPLRNALQAGQKYVETWKKYEEELVKWKEGGSKPPAKAKDETETAVEQTVVDPITGTWQVTLSGGPLPEKVTVTVTLKLTGTTIEGRMTDPEGSGEEVGLTGTLNGKEVTLEIDQDTPLGKPRIVATLDRDDHMVGKAIVGDFNIDLEATRTDKNAVEFKVQRQKKRAKDGRPLPPKTDENLEPYRLLLAGKIPAVVDVETAAQINAALKLFVDEFKVPLVLLGAEEAADAGEQILARKDKLGVVVPREMTRRRQRTLYNEAADLSRQGIRVAMQSDAEDGARSLPLMGLFAVREGLGGDAALKALTIDAARMYKLDDRLGSLEPGKDGDVLIFSGHPFDADGRLERVFVGGREVPHE